MAYLLGIDLGTSSLKALLVTETGKVVAESSRKYQFDIPISGYAEQWPQVWWKACREACSEAMARSGLPKTAVAAIGISGQMHGTVALDDAYEPVTPAILHCDARTGVQNVRIQEQLGAERIAELMMNPVYSGFMLPSLLWLRDNEPKRFERIRHVMLPKDYLRLRMTGEAASEYSDASATLLFDMKNGCWSEEILTAFGLPKEILPEIHETTEVAGQLTDSAAQELGLAPGTPVVYGGGDQIMQAIGNGVIGEGMATINIGSSAQICFPVHTLIQNPDNNSNFFCGYKRNHWIAMAATINGGLCFNWIAGLLREPDWGVLNREIAKLRPGCDGLVFLPYLCGERSPHMDPDLSGSFVGLSCATDRYQLARAVMEGVTFALYECYGLCAGMGLDAERLVASGGGARSPQWLQIQADVFGKQLLRTEGEEQAGIGAAITAGVGAGVYRDVAEGCRLAVRYRDVVTEPDFKAHAVYQQYYQVYRKLFQTQKEVIEELTRLGRSQQGSGT